MDSQGVYLNEMVVNSSNEILAFITEDRPPISDTFYILPIDGQQNQITGWKIAYETIFKLGNIRSSVFFESTVCFSHSQSASENSTISCFDVDTGQHWSKKIKGNNSLEGAFLDINDSFEVIVTAPPSNNQSEFFKYNKNGDLLWKKGLSYNDNSSPVLDIYLTSTDIKYGPDGNIYVIGKLCGNDTPGGSFIIEMDSLGNVLKTKTIEEYTIGRMVITGDGIYILNKGYLEFLWSVDPWGFDKAVLVKLDFDLNPIWSKQYRADQFVYSSANIKKTASGKLVMSHTTKGAFPAIFSEIDSEGNILSQKGYPNFRPDMELLSDGSLVLGSRFNFDETGETFIQPLITKTDTNGNVEGCITYPTCLFAEDVEITIATFEVDTVSVEAPDDYGLIVEPVTFSFSQGCNFPSAPIPDFHFPDTLCLSDSARTTDTHNRLANAFEWQLTGPSMDSINMDSFDFGFRFQQAGEYILKHTAWVLGCSYSFEKNITVLPPLEVAITPETLCPDNEEVMAVSDRMLMSYEWNTGGTYPTLPVTASGMYSVQVSDGHCTATDTAEVLLVSDIIGFENPILLPTDTTVCEAHLPFLLEMESGYTDVFLVNGDSVFNGEHLLNSGGHYPVFAEVSGCPFTYTFSLETDDCKAAIYFPTVFSPNNDGINDVFFPQGKGFEAVSLKVFDRWGGLLYDGAGSGVAWRPDGGVAQGVYAYLFFYENRLTGQEGQEAGEVVLVR